MAAERDSVVSGTSSSPIDAVPDTVLISMLEMLHLVRAFDLKVGELFALGKIPGLIHLGVGEEAVAVGTCAALEPSDYVTSTHRAHGHFLAKGGDPRALMAELYGKRTGCCRGKGGSMHLIDLEIGFVGANGVVGAGLPLAVGAALGSRLQGSGRVTVCFFGDGATNQGTFHEALNLGAIWDLPVVFVCENNQFGISLSTMDQQKVEHVADRAVAYGIPGRTIDGNDALEVHRVVRDAVARARDGGGPTLVECKTYRIRGHYEGDSQSYRSKEEVEEWRRKDPLGRLARLLVEQNAIDSTALAAIAGRARERVVEAVAFAEESPFPDPDEAQRDVFEGRPPTAGDARRWPS